MRRKDQDQAWRLAIAGTSTPECGCGSTFLGRFKDEGLFSFLRCVLSLLSCSGGTLICVSEPKAQFAKSREKEEGWPLPPVCTPPLPFQQSGFTWAEVGRPLGNQTWTPRARGLD